MGPATGEGATVSGVPPGVTVLNCTNAISPQFYLNASHFGERWRRWKLGCLLATSARALQVRITLEIARSLQRLLHTQIQSRRIPCFSLLSGG